MAEVLQTEDDIATLFHPALVWIDASTVSGIAEGWCFEAGKFFPPAPPSATATSVSLTDLQSQLAELAARVAALARAE